MPGASLQMRPDFHWFEGASELLISRVRLIGQPERGAFMRTPKTNCDIESVDLAYNRLHNAIRTARMCRA